MDQFVERILNSFEADQVIPGQHGFPDQICLLRTTNLFGRSQPVVVTMQDSNMNPELKVLSLKTPLGNSSVIPELEQSYSLFAFPYEEEFLMVKMCLDPEQTGDFSVYMQVQLLVFATEEEIDLLSKYELNEALNDLIECADLIERYATTNQDIKIEIQETSEEVATKPGKEKNKKTIKKVPIKPKHLRDTIFQENLARRWKYAFNRKYVYLNTEKSDIKSNHLALWELNHQHQFVKYLSINNRLITTLTFFSKDLQLKEQNALEHHFDAICGKIESESNLQTN